MSQQQHPRSTAATSTQHSSNICRSKTVSDWATKVCKYLFNYAHVSARHSECLTEVGQRNVECAVGIQPNWRHFKRSSTRWENAGLSLGNQRWIQKMPWLFTLRKMLLQNIFQYFKTILQDQKWYQTYIISYNFMHSLKSIRF